MAELFLHVVNMSLTGSWLLLAVLLLQPLLRKAPEWLRGSMWGLAALRLVCPFTVPWLFSMVPTARPVPQGILYDPSPEVNTGIAALDNIVNPVLAQELSPDTGDSVNPLQVVVFICGLIWLAVMLGMLVYAAVSWLRIGRQVRESLPAEGNIRISDKIMTPFILGIVRPRIYLPVNLREEERLYVIAHERAHLYRHDHWWKPVGFLVLTVHWFNPLVWAGYLLFCRDVEYACDERVIAEMGEAHKKPYAHALIFCSAAHRSISVCPLAFGEEGVKQRIRHVLHYRKPAFWMILAAVLAGLTAIVCLFGTRWEPDDQLKVFVDCRIAEHHQGGRATENFTAISWELLGTKQKGDRRTLYMWVCCHDYSYDGEIRLESGSHIPTAITVDKEDGAWRLIEYWQAEDGSRYAPSIREKFPFYLWGKATDSQRYAKKQIEECDAMARDYFAQSHAGVTARNMVFQYPDSPEQFPPELVLYLDGTFRFTYSYFSSYLPMGTYDLKDGCLILTTNDTPAKQYVFDGAEEGFVFNAAQSSPIPSYRYSSEAREPECPVPDGAWFVPVS